MVWEVIEMMSDMNFDLRDMVAKYEACCAVLDETKTCITCIHNTANNATCKECYNELLGMPVNPTNWSAL